MDKAGSGDSTSSPKPTGLHDAATGRRITEVDSACRAIPASALDQVLSHGKFGRICAMARYAGQAVFTSFVECRVRVYSQS